MYVHLTVRAAPRTLLFTDWTEALALWRRLDAAFPDARALCLLPDHLHGIAEAQRARERLSAVMSGYARWRNAHRGTQETCWCPQPPVEPLPDTAHLRRSIRYVLLNPCRAGLAGDPLAWALSSHRDHVGLGDPRRKVRDPEGFHGYVSADPTVSVTGTDLPVLHGGRASLASVEVAVGAVLRLQPDELRESAVARRLLLRAAWVREQCDVPTLADWVGVHRASVYRATSDLPDPSRRHVEPWLTAVLRAIDDPRFKPLVAAPRLDATRWSGWRV
jgi:hypothetical protein